MPIQDAQQTITLISNYFFRFISQSYHSLPLRKWQTYTKIAHLMHNKQFWSVIEHKKWKHNKRTSCIYIPFVVVKAKITD